MAISTVFGDLLRNILNPKLLIGIIRACWDPLKCFSFKLIFFLIDVNDTLRHLVKTLTLLKILLLEIILHLCNRKTHTFQ